MDGPLTGYRVVDWTIWQFGPVAGAMLADMGAEVIKLEQREVGDPSRGVALGNTERERVWAYQANNRHKHSLALDLKQPQARQIVYRLVQKSDVFIQNFRKGVSVRHALDYATLARYNPRLIYANASGYGPEGPDSERPAFDPLGQARSGFMYQAPGADGQPVLVGGAVSDQMAASLLAYGVVLALLARERRGLGQELDVSHLGSMIWLQWLSFASLTIAGRNSAAAPRQRANNPLYNYYQCADGQWLVFAMLQADRYWKDFCLALGMAELVDDPRFDNLERRAANAAELIAILVSYLVNDVSGAWTSKRYFPSGIRVVSNRRP